MSNIPLDLTRKQLSDFIRDARTIRAFEQLTYQVNTGIPIDLDIIRILVEEANSSAGTANASANQSLASVEDLRKLADFVSAAPLVQQDNSVITDYLEFNLNPSVVQAPGRMAWNPADDTVDLYHSDGVSQQIGQELYGRILNNTGSLIPNGTALGINPATNSYVPFIANGSLSPLNIVGVTTQDIPNGANGRITVWGRVHDLNTTGAPYGQTWVAGQILYVSPTVAGGFTNVKPTAPNLSIPIAQVLVVSATIGQIAVRPTVEQQLYYGSFIKTTDQTPAAINTAYALTWDSSTVINGVTIGTPTSRIVCANAGLYKFNASYQLTSSSASVKNVWLWFRKNGVDIANSAMVTSLDSATAVRTPSRAILVSMNAGDYIELMFASDSTAMTVDNIASTAFAPATPAAILVVNQEQQ